MEYRLGSFRVTREIVRNEDKRKRPGQGDQQPSTGRNQHACPYVQITFLVSEGKIQQPAQEKGYSTRSQKRPEGEVFPVKQRDRKGKERHHSNYCDQKTQFSQD